MPVYKETEMRLIDFRQAARQRGPQPRGLARLIADFLADGRLAGKSARTLDDHQQQLDRFAAWLQESGRTWREATHADLTAYLRTRAHLGRSSRAHAVTSLRVFYAWLVSEGELTASPAERLKTPPKPKSVPKALSADQLGQLLAHLDTLAAGTPANRRDRLLALTGLYAGLRAAELASLTWDQVDLSGQTITIPESKMARGRTVRLHPDLAAELAAWKAAQPKAGAWVFSLTGDRIVANRVGKEVKALGLAAGVALTAHVLRHTFATWGYRRSGNLLSVSRALGHSMVQTTMVYVRADAKDGEAAVLSLPTKGGDWSDAKPRGP